MNTGDEMDMGDPLHSSSGQSLFSVVDKDMF